MESSPKIGSILLGKYRVERVLGEGGMGVVVAARHEQLGTLFAIKMMQPAALKYRDARERFLREARASARLMGEHVARVHDVGTLENDAPYMLMEHLSGEDLKQFLDKRGVLPVDEAALYVHQACEAIAEAHALGIVHRDLKPANMFLTRRPNGTPCVKVLDFGISKEIDGNAVGPALTKTGAPIGTPMYMAPEQMANNKTTDVRIDVWALGVILYELITGRKPFYAESMTELVTQVLAAEPLPPSQVRPGISREVDAIVLRCLEKKLDKRYASVRELMAVLQPLMKATLSETKPGLQDPPAPPREPAKDTTTVQIPQRAESSSSLSATPLLLATVPLAPVSKPEGTNAAQTGGAWGGTSRVFLANSRKPWMIAAAGGAVLLVIVGVVARISSSSESVAPAASAAATESAAPVVTSAPTGNEVTVKPEGTAVVEAPAQEPVKKTPESTTTATARPTPTARPTATQVAPRPTTRPTSTSRIPDY